MKAILKSLGIVVGIPTLLAAVYFGLFASDIYVSEARFAIRSAKSGASVSGLASLLTSTSIGSGGQESMVVAEYAESLDMMQKVQDRLDIRSHYSSGDVDTLSRLAEDATLEESLAYFRDHVQMVRDGGSDVLTLKARAYSPAMAQELAELVIALSEELVNTMSNRMEADALATAQAEVQRAALKVREASQQISAFRSRNDSLNPAAESSALLGIVSGIESKLVEARAELTEKRAFMRDDSPEVISLRNRVNALTRQLRLERGRLSGDDAQQMSNLIEGYQPLVLDQELAQQQYASALSSLELARLEAQRKKQYLITFIQPSLPDEAVEPRRLAEVLTVLVFSFLAYVIGGLMWSALKDHIGT